MNRTVATKIAILTETILYAMSTSKATVALQDHITEQTNRLVHLLESIDYPYEISPEAIYAQLADQFATATPGDLASAEFASAPALQFVDWLLDNVTAESNWPRYDNPARSSISLDHADCKLDEEEVEQALASLDQQHWQLQ